MKLTRIAYWISTVLFAVLMSFSGFSMLTAQEMKDSFLHLGFSAEVFRIELGVAKIIGVVLLVLPIIKGRLKEWVYAGFTINLLSASIAHFGAGDPVVNIMFPIIFLAVLMTSYFTYHKLKGSIGNTASINNKNIKNIQYEYQS